MESEIDAELRVLEAKTNRLMKRMQQIHEYRLNLDTKTKRKAFHKQVLEMENLRVNFEQAITESNRIRAKADPKFIPTFISLDKFDDLFFEVKAWWQLVGEEQPVGSADQRCTPAEAKPKFSKIQTMDFDGDPLKWPLFYETFKSWVHENPSMDEATKVQCLMGKLKGKAITAVAGVLPTAANYQVLWDTLIREFEDKRALARVFLKQVMEVKPSTPGTGECLDKFVERVIPAVKSLRQLQITDVGEYVLTFLCMSKIDKEYRTLFERSIKRDEFPTFDQLADFIIEQRRALSHATDDASKFDFRWKKGAYVKALAVSEKSSREVRSRSCEMCKSTLHRIYKCPKFVSLSQTERKGVAFRAALCFNCLKSGHAGNNCPSTFFCRRCKGKHHTLLHSDVADRESEKEGQPTEENPTCLVSMDESPRVKDTVLLSTATVLATTRSGEGVRMRVLLDSASQGNFITKKFCKKLKLPVRPLATAVTGIGGAVKSILGQVTVSFKSRWQAHKYHVKAWVIDRITDDLPSAEIDRGIQELLRGQQLADENFAAPGPIDAMIGAELVPILLGPARSLGPNLPSVVKSPLGVIVMGRAPIQDSPFGELQVFCCTSLGGLVQKFWELDNLQDSQATDPDDLACEESFRKSVQRGLDGRFTVALPFERFPPDLGDSFQLALNRFLSLEKKLVRSPEYATLYRSVIRDYLEQGHMQLVEETARDCSVRCYYIPHHGILKSSSTSTPLRVVFDASAASLNGRSLNDCMYAGPKLQNELFDLLVRFRTFAVAMTADVKQMYRQIWVSPEHRPFQRLLWRFNQEEPIRTYELTTVTFGVKASPFLALRTVKELALEEGKRFPLAAGRVARELYMDDVVSSVSGIREALELYRQWVGLFRAGGFQLTKWATNSPELLKYIPQENRRGGAVDFPTDILTVLGLRWDPARDEFIFKVNVENTTWSKRSILSTMARIWDPLGLLTPVTVSVKLLMKNLWSSKTDWDDPLPPAVQRDWEKFVSELSDLCNFKVSRYIGINSSSNIYLVGFSDASEKAYAAAVYLLIKNSGETWKSRLLCAKAKVAPMKTVSVPRLELCGALLLARLLNLVVKIYKGMLPIQNVYAFSDSTVVLHWLQGAPHRWKTFVANRVVKIKEYLPEAKWGHVKGEENPADCASRGLSPTAFLEQSLWLEGPSWLLHSPENWSKDLPLLEEGSVDLEERPVQCMVTTTPDAPICDLIQRCGSWSKMLKTMIFILRFGGKLPRRDEFKASDYETAEITLVKVVQRTHFASLIQDLRMKKSVDKFLRSLTPFLQDGIVRVGGRLRNSSLKIEQRHPILLPKGDNFTNLLIDYMHLQFLHAGPTLLMGLLRQKYWILGARDLVRRRLHRCNRCFRCKPLIKPPMMADLPVPRVAEVKPFAHTGVDFAGPFRIALSRTRGAKVTKGYLCIFICLSTRAVHLEGASDLSTDICVAAIKRFLSRRGPCSVLYSDQGTNFVGSKRYLDELEQFRRSPEFQRRLQGELSTQRIEWKLNPPSAPHFGGSWEAGVKSVKFHFTRVIGDQVLTFEEFTTVLCQIEAVLNSRPLCWLSTDPADPVALTPAHFLTLTPLNDLPAPEITAPINRLQRKELLDKMIQGYWSRWRLEYLSSLQKKMKWNTPSCSVQPGTLVLVHQDNAPPLQWPLGKIQEVYPGRDGVVRVALVKTKSGSFKRPVHKLAPLPTQ